MIHLDELALANSGPVISVGLLAADLQVLGTEVDRLKRAGVHLLHFDVSDGCLLPALTFAAPAVAAIHTDMVKDVHLMVRDPLEKIPAYINAGADILTIQLEFCLDARSVFRRMTSLAAESGKRILRGLALKANTSVIAVDDLLEEIDYVLLLSIEPDRGKQLFCAETASRVSAIREMAVRRNRSPLVGVDGGITRTNVREIAEMGPDILVTGSAIFDGGDPVQNYRAMAEAVRSAEVTLHDQAVVK